MRLRRLLGPPSRTLAVTVMATILATVVAPPLVAILTDDFVMTDGNELAPALGHHAESRQRFRLPIRGSFAGIALDHGRVQWSNDLDGDTRFQRHPKSSPKRNYQSIVSVPLWRSGQIAGSST